FSVSSSAALRPTSGLAPAPRPLVSFAPSCSFTGACESFSAWRSVLAVMNSTPSSLARIIRFTALQPPPPTPMTLIFAGCRSSLKLMRIPASLVVIFPQSSPVSLAASGRVTTRRRTWPSIWIPDFLSAGAQSDAPLRHTTRVPLRLHIPAEPPVPADQPSLLAPRRARADGKTARQVPPARGGGRRRPRGQIRQGFARQ